MPDKAGWLRPQRRRHGMLALQAAREDLHVRIGRTDAQIHQGFQVSAR